MKFIESKSFYVHKHSFKITCESTDCSFRPVHVQDTVTLAVRHVFWCLTLTLMYVLDSPMSNEECYIGLRVTFRFNINEIIIENSILLRALKDINNSMEIFRVLISS